jgi:Na+/H+-dicarboxylate symporter
MFMLLVPLVFFSISSAIASMNSMVRFGKIMGSVLLVFFGTALVTAIIGVFGTLAINPLRDLDVESMKHAMTLTPPDASEPVSVLQRIVDTFTVTDFQQLLSRANMLPMIVFSILVGSAASLTGEKGKPFGAFLSSGTEVMMRVVSFVMYYAPIGLGAYFATVIGELGPQIIGGYAKLFFLYVGFTLLFFFGFFTLYAFLAGGKAGISIFWRNVIPPAITAIATCSSAASIPVNLEATKKMGVPEDIAETVIPLGANTHKDGSVLGGVLKIVFLFTIFGREMTSPSAIVTIIAVSFLVGAVMGAIPGGGMIAELMIVSLFGFPFESAALILIISTIIDMPATLLNSTGNTVSSMMVSRLVEGKDWLKEDR